MAFVGRYSLSLVLGPWERATGTAHCTFPSRLRSRECTCKTGCVWGSVRVRPARALWSGGSTRLARCMAAQLWCAARLKVGKSPTATPRRAELPVA
eukprot:scaffold19387_cov64-Phaeocystis_antarctica.AAC.2